MTYRLKLGSMYQDQDLIFPGEFGEPLRCPQNIVIDHYKPILRKARLPDLRLYDLRYSTATLLFAAGAPSRLCRKY